MKPFTFSLNISNAESRRAFELADAFQQHQITLGELGEAVQPLSSESLHVIATFWNPDDPELEGCFRVSAARNRYKQLAARSRCYS